MLGQPHTFMPGLEGIPGFYLILLCLNANVTPIPRMESLIGRTSTTEITVRSWTLDLYGQVSNYKFLEFLEEARWNHFQGFFESGMFMDLGLAFVLVNVNLNYRDAAVLGDVLDIETCIKRIGEKSITLHHHIVKRQSQETVIDGEVTFVVKDLEKGVAVPITGRMRDMFLREMN